MEERTERRLMRQRGAGVRMVSADFGFSLGFDLNDDNEVINATTTQKTITTATEPPRKTRKSSSIRRDETSPALQGIKTIHRSKRLPSDIYVAEDTGTKRPVRKARKRLCIEEDQHKKQAEVSQTDQDDSFLAGITTRKPSTRKRRTEKGSAPGTDLDGRTEMEQFRIPACTIATRTGEDRVVDNEIQGGKIITVDYVKGSKVNRRRRIPVQAQDDPEQIPHIMAQSRQPGAEACAEHVETGFPRDLEVAQVGEANFCHCRPAKARRTTRLDAGHRRKTRRLDLVMAENDSDIHSTKARPSRLIKNGTDTCPEDIGQETPKNKRSPLTKRDANIISLAKPPPGILSKPRVHPRRRQSNRDDEDGRMLNVGIAPKYPDAAPGLLYAQQQQGLDVCLTDNSDQTPPAEHQTTNSSTIGYTAGVKIVSIPRGAEAASDANETKTSTGSSDQTRGSRKTSRSQAASKANQRKPSATTSTTSRRLSEIEIHQPITAARTSRTNSHNVHAPKLNNTGETDEVDLLLVPLKSTVRPQGHQRGNSKPKFIERPRDPDVDLDDLLSSIATLAKGDPPTFLERP